MTEIATVALLKARIAELERENAKLRFRLEAEASVIRRLQDHNSAMAHDWSRLVAERDTALGKGQP